MLRTDPVSLHVPEPLALIDVTLLFTVQVLIARHPELLLPSEVPVLHPPPGYVGPPSARWDPRPAPRHRGVPRLPPRGARRHPDASYAVDDDIPF